MDKICTIMVIKSVKLVYKVKKTPFEIKFTKGYNLKLLSSYYQ